MAQFDYYDGPSAAYLVDIQSVLLSHLNTAIVIPLFQRDRVPNPVRHLHPTFEIDGIVFILATHLLTAIPSRELGNPRGSLARHRDEILRALDTLLVGV